jgi:hypothetical protein
MKGGCVFSNAFILLLQMLIAVGGFGHRIYLWHQSRFYVNRYSYSAHQGCRLPAAEVNDGSTLSLSGLLNSLNGVAAAEGQ